MKSELATTFHDQPKDRRARDLLLNALTVSSGAVDAISFLALGRVFSAFMTGNIAFLGLPVAYNGGESGAERHRAMPCCIDQNPPIKLIWTSRHREKHLLNPPAASAAYREGLPNHARCDRGVFSPAGLSVRGVIL